MHHRNTIFPGILLLVGGTLLFWLMADQPEWSGHPSHEITEGRSPLSRTGMASPSNVADGRSSRKQISKQETSGGPPALTGQEEGLLIRVTEVGTGRPVEEADVFYFDLGLGYDFDHLALHDLNPDAYLSMVESRGSHFRSDAQGHVRVPIPNNSAQVMARSGELFGLLEVDSGDRSVLDLVLSPSHSLKVKVVDQSGKAIPGVAVLLRDQYPNRYFDRLVAVTGNGDGIAIFPGVDHFLPKTKSKRKKLVVALAIPVSAGLSQVIHPGDVPKEPLVLVMPPTGTISVSLQGFRSGSLRSDVYVVIEDLAIGKPYELGQGCRAERYTVPVEGDWIRIPGVGLGLNLRVTAFRLFGAGSVSTTIQGPKFPGENVNCTIDCGKAIPLVSGCLLTEKGLPLAKRIIHLVEEMSDEDGSGTQDDTTVTDQNGRFFYALDQDWEDTRRTLHISAGTAGNRVCISRDISFDLGLGEVMDLGNLQMHRPALLIGGKVIDSKGRPVPRVAVNANLGSFGCNTVTDTRGRFEIRGNQTQANKGDGDSGYLSFSKPGYVAFYLENPVLGSGSQMVTLQTAGEVGGRVIWDKVIEAKDIRLSVSKSNVVKSPRRRDGRFLFTGIPPGLSRFRVWAGAESDPIFDITDLVIKSGKGGADPRLNPIDLRGCLHRITLMILGPDGRPIIRGRVRWGKGFRSSSDFADGKWSEVISKESTCSSIRISAPGMKSMVLSGADGEARVFMVRDQK